MRIVIFSLLSAMLVFSACSKERITGSGSVTTETRSVNGFTKLALAGSSDVFITKGDQFKVQVKGYGNLLPLFETRVVSGTLELGFNENVDIRNDNIEVFVTMPALNGLAIAGSGDIRATGDFKDNAAFDTEIFGSGNIDIQDGESENFSAEIAGSGNVKAYGFTAKKASVEIAGSGDTKLTVVNKLNVRISGSGNVYYKGSPDVSANISGSGAVIKQ